MSHFTTVKMEMKNKAILERMARARSWTMAKEVKHVNGWSKETVPDATVFKAGDKYKLVLDAKGVPVVDSYYMGRDYEKFIQDYAAEVIREQAMSEGASVVTNGYDKNGNLLLEVQWM